MNAQHTGAYTCVGLWSLPRPLFVEGSPNAPRGAWSVPQSCTRSMLGTARIYFSFLFPARWLKANNPELCPS